jgi:hypothetical protein
VQHPFNFTNKEVIFVLFILVIGWKEQLVAIKKKLLPLFVKVKALFFFSKQYGHTNF